jgi:hypothetical protein
MAVSGVPTSAGRWAPSLRRGGGLFAGVGGVLGATVGTVDWPVVGTFFGAIGCASAGVTIGVADAALLTLLARRTRSKWAARVASGVVAAAGLGWASTLTGPAEVPRPLAAALLAIALLLGAALGPLIAYGAAPAPDGRPTGPGYASALARFLRWGAALGGGAGAVTGLAIGIRAYLPTSPFAAVEGAAFGVVSGVALGCLAAGVFLLPRVRAGL